MTTHFDPNHDLFYLLFIQLVFAAIAVVHLFHNFTGNIAGCKVMKN